MSPVAVIVPVTYSAVLGVVVPMPTLPVLVTFRIFVVVPTVRSVAGVVVPMPTLPPVVAAVNVPVDARLDAVIEPVFPFTINKPPAAVKVPVTVVDPVVVNVVVVSDPKVALVVVNVVIFPVAVFTTAAVIEPVFPFTVNKPPAAVTVPVTVADPVVVNTDTVVEPALIVPVIFILLLLDKEVAVIPLNTEPSPENFVAVIVPFVNISERKCTVVVPWRLVFALIVPIDKKPAVIVPKLPDVAEPTYNAEFRVEVFVPIRMAPSFLTERASVPLLFLTLSDASLLEVEEPAT
ncbi:MAG: hypothetical protein HYV59_12220 [Planctomycetes bacterium]|nr:hypothetical protein [Planctomycetota bacterium]